MTVTARTITGIAVLLLATLTLSGCGNNDSTRVLAASSLQDALPELLDAYTETAGDVTFEVQYGGSQALATQIELGAEADLFLSANSAQLDRLDLDERIERQVPFVLNRLVIAVEHDSTIREIGDLADPEWRIAVGAADVPVGALTETALDTLAPDIAAAIRANVVTQDPNVRVVLSRLELGEVDAAFVYATDVAILEGIRAIEVGGTEPNVYVGGVIEGAEPGADTFLEFLAGHEAAAIWQAAGFEPLNAAVGAR